MALGKRKDGLQRNLFVYVGELRSSSNAFYQALDRLLCDHGFDAFVEGGCREFYADRRGRPGVPPISANLFDRKNILQSEFFFYG